MAEMLSSPLCVLHMHVQRLQRVVHCLNNICFVPGGNGVLIINKKKGRKKKHRGGGTLAKRISRKKRTKRKFLVIEFLHSLDLPTNLWVANGAKASIHTSFALLGAAAPSWEFFPFYSLLLQKNKRKIKRVGRYSSWLIISPPLKFFCFFVFIFLFISPSKFGHLSMNRWQSTA